MLQALSAASTRPASLVPGRKSDLSAQRHAPMRRPSDFQSTQRPQAEHQSQRGKVLPTLIPNAGLWRYHPQPNGPSFGACLQRSTNVTGTGHTSRDFPSSRRDRIRPSAAMCRPSRPVPPRTGAKRALEAAFRRAVAVGGFVRSIRRAKSRPYHQFADGKDASVPSSIQRLQPASPGNLAVATASSRSAIPCCLRSPLRRQTRIQPKPQHRTME